MLNAKELLALGKVVSYATKAHNSTNHMYDGMTYVEGHLEHVYANGLQFLHLVNPDHHLTVLSGCWVHDIIEDARETYNNVKDNTNEEVAEIAYALTNEKGRTRADRASIKYYEGIRATPNATFVKLCDRIANVQHGLATGSSMLKKYKQENVKFRQQLYTLELQEMFDYLDGLI